MTTLPRGACPDQLEVLLAPFDVALGETTVLQPDLLVARRTDLTLKRSRFEAAGCASYWVLDPSGPSLVAWELQGGEYVEVGRFAGAATFRAESPFAVDITPAELLR